MITNKLRNNIRAALDPAVGPRPTMQAHINGDSVVVTGQAAALDDMINKLAKAIDEHVVDMLKDILRRYPEALVAHTESITASVAGNAATFNEFLNTIQLSPGLEASQNTPAEIIRR